LKVLKRNRTSLLQALAEALSNFLGHTDDLTDLITRNVNEAIVNN